MLGRSRKMCCSATPLSRDDIDDTRPCQLYVVDGKKKILGVCGTIFQVAIVLHGKKRSNNEVKIMVEEVLGADTLVLC